MDDIWWPKRMWELSGKRPGRVRTQRIDGVEEMPGRDLTDGDWLDRDRW